MLRAIVSFSLVMFGINAYAANSCPQVNGLSRANIHTEVEDLNTGQLRGILSGRSFMYNGIGVFVINSTSACPPQGCAPTTTGTSQDCTASQTPGPFFSWAITAGLTDAVQSTMETATSIKSPSGTVVFDQATGATSGTCHLSTGGTPAVVTAVSDNSNHQGLYVESVRIYKGPHGGSGPIDFYTVIGVRPNMTYAFPTSGITQDCTATGSLWYDTYWSRTGSTVMEDIVPLPGFPSILQLNQGGG